MYGDKVILFTEGNAFVTNCRLFPVADNGETEFILFIPDRLSSLFWFYSSLGVSAETFTS
ncbi:hypothetical protein cypCar_00021300 [Cyprinus carpio]|nr:hypothetical protein cypCar_00021300 [Cyprinus carpio]